MKNAKTILGIASAIIVIVASVLVIVHFFDDIKAFFGKICGEPRRPSHEGDDFSNFADSDEFADFADV